MQSTSDIEILIAVKRREIEKEKTQLGLSPPFEEHVFRCRCTKKPNDDKENAVHTEKHRKQVKFSDSRVLCERDDNTKNKKEKVIEETSKEFDDYIPPSLERYIRKYLGLPVMLKAGEYSPNNPLVRGERAPGDALLGLGEYERRRNTLRKIRQQQYREYLDQQAKKKQEAKEQVERERREREQREREREQRERELLEERDRYSPERRRSVTTTQVTPTTREQHSQCVASDTTAYHVSKVDTAVQVDGFAQPLSVAVQTDDTQLFPLSPPQSPTKYPRTCAERELSPRSVVHQMAPHDAHYSITQHERRRSYGDFDERNCLLKKCARDSLIPSIFDGDAIRLRNMQAEKEAAERRQFYQQELKNQIQEQQRIREERKTREKMLEQAEMRRLEDQLRMLRMAQDREVGKQRQITANMKENALEYNNKRTELQNEIDAERHKLVRVSSQPIRPPPKRTTNTSKSDTVLSKLPFYYSKVHERNDNKPYSMNIPDNSIFSSNYDVDSYLRRNLNFNKDKVSNIFENVDYKNVETPTESMKSPERKVTTGNMVSTEKTVEQRENNVIVEKALIHEIPKTVDRPQEVIDKQPSRQVDSIDSLPIPVLRHSPRTQIKTVEDTGMSEAMKKVDDKWKVPAVQKNILKALPNEEGKNVSILTQLGSIRRQLQLEQLKLDKMLSKDDNAV